MFNKARRRHYFAIFLSQPQKDCEPYHDFIWVERLSSLLDRVVVIRPLILAALPLVMLAAPASAQIRVDARIQMSSGSCAGCDLSNKSMNGVQLKDANLSGSLFNNSNLSGGSLDGSDLSGAQFRSALMYRVIGDRVTLRRAVLEDATLTEANLSNSKFENANLSRADLTRAVISDTDFNGAQFDNANLTAAQFQSGQFQNARFNGTILIDAKLDNANFSGADMSTVQGLKQAQLDVACGDERTRLPVGLSLPYCDDVSPVMPQSKNDDMDEELKIVAKRLDRAIADVENLLAASDPRDRALRTRLQRIHSDLAQSKAALTR